MMYLLIASFHAQTIRHSVRRWNAFSWLACVSLFGAGTCKSKSAVESIKSATLLSNASSTTVAPSSKRSTQGKQLVVTAGSNTKENTSAISTSPQASKATQSGGTAIGSKQTNTSSATSEKPPAFSFKEQCFTIQTEEQKQLTLQASGNTNGYVVKSVFIKKGPSTTPYQNQFGLKDCIEKKQPCFFPESGFNLNLYPIATLTAGTYTLTIRLGKQGVNSNPTNQCISCEIVLIKREKVENEAFVGDKIEDKIGDKIEDKSVRTHIRTQENREEKGRSEPKKETGTHIQDDLDQNQSKARVVTFSEIQNLESRTLICKVGEKITVDYEVENAGKYVISNVQMIKLGNKNSSPRKKDFNMDLTKYNPGSVFENTITFCANKKGVYTLCLTLKDKVPKKVEQFSCLVAIEAE